MSAHLQRRQCRAGPGPCGRGVESRVPIRLTLLIPLPQSLPPFHPLLSIPIIIPHPSLPHNVLHSSHYPNSGHAFLFVLFWKPSLSSLPTNHQSHCWCQGPATWRCPGWRGAIPAGSVLHHRAAQHRANAGLPDLPVPGPALHPATAHSESSSPGLSAPFRLISWHACPRRAPERAPVLLPSAQPLTLCSQPVSEANMPEKPSGDKGQG